MGEYDFTNFDYMNPMSWMFLGKTDPQTYGPLLDSLGLDANTVAQAAKNGGFDPETQQRLAQMSAAHSQELAGSSGTNQLAGGPGADTLGPGAVRPTGRAGMGPLAKNNLGSLTEPAVYGPTDSAAAMAELPPGRPVGSDILREPYPTPPAKPIYGPQEPTEAARELPPWSGGVGSDYGRFPPEGAGGEQYGPPIPAGSMGPAQAAPTLPNDPRIAANRQLAAQQGFVGPKAPNPPPMHGGVTGGVKTPEAKPIKPGSAAIQALLAALQQKPVPTLGHLVG